MHSPSACVLSISYYHAISTVIGSALRLQYFIEVWYKRCNPSQVWWNYYLVFVNSLLMVRLYWRMGSDIVPATAGPNINPEVIAQLISDIPNAWLLSSEFSDTTALTVPLTAGEIQSPKYNLQCLWNALNWGLVQIVPLIQISNLWLWNKYTGVSLSKTSHCNPLTI